MSALSGPSVEETCTWGEEVALPTACPDRLHTNSIGFEQCIRCLNEGFNWSEETGVLVHSLKAGLCMTEVHEHCREAVEIGASTVYTDGRVNGGGGIMRRGTW